MPKRKILMQEKKKGKCICKRERGEKKNRDKFYNGKGYAYPKRGRSTKYNKKKRKKK